MGICEDGGHDGSGSGYAQDGRGVEKGGRTYVHQGRVAGETEDLVRVRRDGRVCEQLHRKASRNLCKRLRHGATK